MPKFEVRIAESQVCSGSFTIEADSLEIARDIAAKMSVEDIEQHMSDQDEFVIPNEDACSGPKVCDVKELYTS